MGLSLAWESPSDAAAQPACKFIEIGTADIVAARDGRTLLLRDGGELRLAGIEAATPAAKDALTAMAAGKSVTLKRHGVEKDRYGRLLVYAFAPGSARSVQEELLVNGQAQTGTRIGDMSCVALLRNAEKSARKGKTGLWSDPNYALLRADDPARVSAQTGRFAVVEGSVLSVREAGSTIYVNFGRRWSEDFTVTIFKRNERSFTAVGLEPKRLEGRSVRVRGFVESRGGPMIEALRPEQIEVIE